MKKLFAKFFAVMAMAIGTAVSVFGQNGFTYQAVIRDSEGVLVTGRQVEVTFSLKHDGTVYYSEKQEVRTNEYGNIQVVVGEGEKLDGDFASVPWSTFDIKMEVSVEIDGKHTTLGEVPVQGAPYAMHAQKAGGLTSKNANTKDGEALFSVNDASGNPVFAVFADGIVVYVDDTDAKAKRSGFVVTGRSATKGESATDYFSVTAEGTQIYVDDVAESQADKAKRSGFVVTGRSATKDGAADYLTIDGKGTTVYVEDDSSKAKRSGFVVTGRSATKDGLEPQYFAAGADGTTVYVDDTSSDKAKRSGFVVTGRTATKGGDAEGYLTVDGSGTQVYVDGADAEDKARRSGFVVTGRSASKAEEDTLFAIEGGYTRVYVDEDEAGKAKRSGFVVTGRAASKDNTDLFNVSGGGSVEITTNEFAVNDGADDTQETDTSAVEPQPGDTASTPEPVVQKPKSLFTVSSGNVQVGTEMVMMGEVAKKIEADTISVDTVEAEMPVIARIVDRADTVSCAAYKPFIYGGESDSEGYALLGIYSKGTLAKVTATDTRRNTVLLIDADGNVTKRQKYATVAVLMPEGDTQIYIRPLKATSQTISFGLMRKNAAEPYQYIKVEAEIEATAGVPYKIGTSSNYGGRIAIDGTVAYGDQPTFEPEPMTGYKFVRWSDGSTRAKRTFTILDDFEISAEFERMSYVVAVKSDNERFGTVTGSGSGTYWHGDTLRVEAEPATGYYFSNWSGAELGDSQQSSSLALEVTSKLKLIAHFGVKQYTITFDTDGGSEIAPAVVYYQDKVSAPAEPQREGYRFLDWEPRLPKEMPAEDLTVKATWSVKQYLITFDTDGGTPVDIIDANYGETVTAPADPEREGYTFAGWSDSIPATMPARDLKLTALWTVNSYELTWDANGGQFAGGDSVAVDTVDYGAKVLAPSTAPNRTGYTFAGWKLDGTDEVPAMMPAKAANILAQWTVNEYKLTWDANGGAFENGKADSVVTVAYGAEVAAPSTAPGRTGYTFAGWKLDGTDEVPAMMPAKATNILAQWTVNKHTIIYMVEDTVYAKVDSVAYGMDIKPVTIAEKPGYTFSGWKLNGKDELPKTMPDSTVVLAGKWTANDSTAYTVIVYVQNADNEEYGELPESSETYYGTTGTKTNYEPKEREGFTASVEQKTISGDGSTKIYVYYNRISYSLIWNANGGAFENGKADSVVTVAYGAKVAALSTVPGRTGYTFAGWKLDGADEVPAMMPAKATNILAQWTVNQYMLTYMVDGKQDGETETLDYGQKITLRVVETREGYTFSGWKLNGKDELPQTMPDSNVVLTGSWTANDIAYTVEHWQEDLDGKYAKTLTDTLTGKADAQTDAKAKTMTGFEAQTFSNEAIGTANYRTAVTIRYKRLSYQLTWNANGGTIDGKSERIDSLLFGAPIVAPTVVREGYECSGWGGLNVETMPASDLSVVALWGAGEVTYTVEHKGEGTDGGYIALASQTLTGVTGSQTAAAAKEFTGFAAPENIEQQTIAADGTTIVTIVYKRNSYRLIWDANGGTINGKAADTVPVGYGVAISRPAEPSQKGYTFLGWEPEVPATMPAKDTAFHAKWDTLTYTISFKDTAGSTFAMANPIKYTVNDEIEIQNPEKAGYTFLGWTGGKWETATQNIVIKNDVGDFELKANWSANVVGYIVRHNFEDLQGGYSIVESEPSSGATDDWTAAAAMTRTGFTLRESVVQQRIKADESTIIDIYYIRDSYTLTWKDGDETIDSEDIKFEATVTMHSSLTRDGYNFLGWSDTLTTMPAASTTLTAVWAINQYTITFESNGGSAVASITDDYDAAVTAPADPTHTGYTFKGWATTATATADDVVAIASKMPVDGATYYAVWAINQYTITYDLDGGTVATANAEGYTVVSEDITLNNPTRTGYTFAGWTGTGLTEATTEVTIAKGSTGNRTFTATWSPISYTITVTANPAGGGTATGGGSYDYDGTATLKATPATGYDFTGWDDGVTTEQRTVNITGAASYVANFTKKTFTVTTSANEAEGSVTISGTTVNGKYEYGSTIAIIATPATGYHFVNWNGKDELKDAETSFTVTKDSALTANFAIDQFSVTFGSTDETLGTVAATVNGEAIASGSKVDYGTEVTLTATPVAHYHFHGWNDAYSYSERTVTVSDDIAYVAGFAPDIYDITLVANNGTDDEPDEMSVTYGTATTLNQNNFERRGYTFAGWALEEGGEPVFADKANLYVKDNADTWILSSTTFYAKWTANTNTPYSVVVYKQKVDGSGYDAETLQMTGTTGTEVNYEEKFTGFTLNPAVPVTISGDGDTQLEVYYLRNSYALTWDANGGKFESGKADSVATVAYGANVEMPKTAPKKTGYTFKGWSDTLTTMPAENTTLTAVWAINQYTVTTPEAYNGTVTGAGTYDYGTQVTITATPDAHYQFVSWNSNIELGGPTASFTVTKDTTLEATFEPIMYSLSWDANGGSDLTGSYTIGRLPFGEQISAPDAPTRAGYQFLGWATTADATEAVTVPATMPDADVTYYAVWKLLTTLYVAPEAGSPALGTADKPFGSIADAAAAMNSDTANYTIRISGKIAGTQKLANTLNGRAKSITLCGLTGNTADSLYGNNAGTVLIDSTTVPVTVKNLKISGGNAVKGGGIIVASGATVMLESGALIGGTTGTAVASSNLACANYAQQGGGVYSEGTLILKNGSAVIYNYSDNGGGIFSSGGSLTIEDGAKVNLNGGGGIVLNGSAFAMTGGEVCNNISSNGAGGIYILGTCPDVMTISGGTISGNSVGSDGGSGGIYYTGGKTLSISGTAVISGNHSVYEGGGIRNSSGLLALSGGTISGNYSEIAGRSGGGIAAIGSGYITISDSAYIPSGATINGTFKTGLGCNDVLQNWGSITVVGAITPSAACSNGIVANITPRNYVNGNQLLLLADTVTTTTLAAEVGKFRVSDTDTTDLTVWYIDAEGKLQSAEFTGTGYSKTGSTVQFGDWPQTIKAADVTVNERAALQRGYLTYYLGSDGEWYVKEAEKAFGTGSEYKYSNNTQPAQGGTSYQYFKVEPIKWDIRTNNYSGAKMMLAQQMLTGNIPYYVNTESRTIDSATVNANNYKYSTVRAYLNGSYEEGDTQPQTYNGRGFFQTAFTPALQAQILTTNVDGTLSDKLFLLNNSEASGAKSTTDYGKATNVYISSTYKPNGSWMLRSISGTTNMYIVDISLVGWDGHTKAVNNTCYGVVPALCLEADFEVNFVTNCDTVIAKQMVERGAFATEPAITRKDYTLLGWYGDEACTEAFDFAGAIIRDTTLYAKWRQDFVEVGGTHFDSTAVEGSSVFISGREFAIQNLVAGTHEVTQAEYEAVMGVNPSHFNGTEGFEPSDGEVQAYRPVDSVSWYDAIVYCNRRSQAEGLTACYKINGDTATANWGKVPTSYNNTWNAVTCDFEANGYRLPTEAEWEYLARGGNLTNIGQTTYSGSNSVDSVAWYTSNSNGKTHEVMKKKANALGLYDMSGNVYELCWDWSGTITSGTAATGALPGSTCRVRRGGSCDHSSAGQATFCAVSYSSWGSPHAGNHISGFRVVRTNVSATTHTVSINAMNGSAATNRTVWDGYILSKPATPTREGYVFLGWYGTADYTKPFDFAGAITSDTTIYAKWGQYYAKVGGTLYYDKESTISAISQIYKNDTIELYSAVTAADLGKADEPNTIINAIKYIQSLIDVTLVVPADANIELKGDCSNMFEGVGRLVSADLSGLNTSKVTNMSYMFNGCSALTTLDLSGWNLGNVSNMSYMFERCSALTTLDMIGWDVSNVSNMCSMFERCSALTTLDLSGFNTEKVTDMSSMFSYCSGFTALDLSSFNTAKVTNMSNMFYSCTSLTTIYTAPDADWSGIGADKSDNMFGLCPSLKGGNGTTWSNDFADCLNATLARIDGGMGYEGYFTNIKTVVGSVNGVYYSGEDIYAAIQNATDDTLKVVLTGKATAEDYGWVVYAISQSPASSVSLVISETASIELNSDYYFVCVNIVSADLRGLKTGNVTSMSQMFKGWSSLKKINLSSFNTENVTDMSEMFSGCQALTTIYTAGGTDWYKEGVTSTGMFSGCSNLVGGNGTKCDGDNNIDATRARIDGVNSQPGYFTKVRMPGEPYAKVDGLLYDDLASTIAAINTSTADTTEVVIYSGVTAADLFKGKVNIIDNFKGIKADSRKARLIVDKDANIVLGADCSHLFNASQILVSVDLRGLNTSAVTNMSYMFSGCLKLTSLDLSCFNTENVTDMSYMFSGCLDLTTLDLSSFNTGSVTDMNSMFYNSNKLTTIYAANGANWYKDGLISTDMFKFCTKLVGGSGTAFNSSAIDATRARVDGVDGQPGYFTRVRMPGELYAMVNDTLYDDLASTVAAINRLNSNSDVDSINLVLYSGVPGRDLGKAATSGTIINAFQTIKGTPGKPVCLVVDKDANIALGADCSNMFKGKALFSADLRGLNTSAVINMSYMFSGCPILTSLDLSSFNTENVTDMSNMFIACSALTTIYATSGANWGASDKLSNSTDMFAYCTKLVGGNGTAFNSSSAIDATRARIDGVDGQPGYFTRVRYAMVDGTLYDDLASTIAAITNSAADTTKVVLYSGVTGAELGKAVTENTIIYSIASSPAYINLVVPKGANIVLGEDCSSMFSSCQKIVSADLRGLNTSSVTNMNGMFKECTALKTLDVSRFNTEKVTNMGSMFRYCQALITLDVSSFNIEKVTNMLSMFGECKALTTIYAAPGADWSGIGANNSRVMFSYCSKLVGGNGTTNGDIDATYARVDGLNGQPGYFTSTGVLGGRFSVSAGKQVYFSQGNLQYQASTNTWRFAGNQWDTVGSANANISSSYTGWIDLFGWGTSGYNNKYPYMTSTTDSDYGDGENNIAGTEYDWGVHNAISNGGKQAGLWRTLTQEEWAYMLEDESRSGKYGFGKVGIVDDSLVNGLILLPDDWTHPTDISSSSSQTFTSGKSDSGTSWPNTYTAADWAKMQAAGAVFLPAAGYRAGTAPSQVGNMGNYWLATANGSSKAYRLYFTPTDIDGASASNRNYGFSVRLVRDK